MNSSNQNAVYGHIDGKNQAGTFAALAARFREK